MAVGTLAERNTRVSRGIVRSQCMTFLARDLSMQAGQRVAGFRMIELSNVDRFPIREVVALGTIRAEAAFVLVRVAGSTGLRKPEERSVQIHLDSHPLQRRNFRR